MQFIYDNLSALIVGSVIILIVVMVGQRGQNMSVEATGRNASQGKMLGFTAFVKQDLRNLGGAGAQDQPIVSGTDSSFTFKAPVHKGDTTAAEISYRRKFVKKLVSGDSLYQVARYVDDSFHLNLDKVLNWQLICLDENGDTLSFADTTYKSATKAVNVALKMQPAFRQTSESGSFNLRWRSVVYPPILQ